MANNIEIPAYLFWFTNKTLSSDKMREENNFRIISWLLFLCYCIKKHGAPLSFFLTALISFQVCENTGLTINTF